MTGQQVSQILWVGEHPHAASLPSLAASNLAIIALDQVDAALAYLAAGHPVDGMLLDLTASATEGLDSLQALQVQAPELPVIVWVSPAQTALGLEAVGAGAEDYLIKGQTPTAELWRAVGCALERHRRQRAITPPHSPNSNVLDTVAQQNQRYHKIFQEVPVSLWEEDWSAVTALTRDLQRQGITDFATYIDQHPEFVTQAMQQVQVLDVNQATLDIFKAQTKADMLGSLEAMFSTPDTLPGFKNELTAFCLGEPAFESEMARRTVTGELIHAWVKTTFPDWRNGSSRVLVSLLNISERVQLEAKRKHTEALLTTRIRQQEAVTQLGLAATGADRLEPILQQAVEQVAAVLDVEFCTILELTAAGSQLQLVAGVGWHPDRMDTVTVRLDQASQAKLTLRSLADMIARAAHRGADLTQRLLGFARRQTLDPQPVDVNQLIAHMHGLLRRTLGEQIEVRCSGDDHLGLALVDAAQLESALLNLCINARDAMGGVGCLTLTTAPVHIAPEGGDRPGDPHPGDYIIVTVSDTGVGMTADLLSRAFEPFFTTKDKDKGTGLGLSMVYSFVCQSNGHVTIDSEPGVGTMVRLYLPRCGDRQRLALEGPALEGDQPPEAVIYGGDSELILLVEDNALVRDYARQQLESLGYQVLVAANGPAALGMLQQRPEIDLLFTDVLMPGGLNGRELAAAAHQLLPQLRVLYTSGYAENIFPPQDGPETEIQLLHKPYQRAELAHKIRQALTGGQP